MELITPSTAAVLAYYDHSVWGKYAAITRNTYGKGIAYYIGCGISNAVTEKIIEDAVKKAGLWGDAQKLAFPVITKGGVNGKGKTVRYIFNYAATTITINYPFTKGKELLSGQVIAQNSSVELEPWGVKIVEEK